MGIAGMRTRRAFTDDGIGLTGTVDRRNKGVVGARTPKSLSRTEASVDAHNVSSQPARTTSRRSRQSSTGTAAIWPLKVQQC